VCTGSQSKVLGYSLQLWSTSLSPCRLLPPVASKPGTCVKVLTIEPPPADPRLRADMALLADCALPSELRVLKGMPAWWA
jgi:hypothetical protein